MGDSSLIYTQLGGVPNEEGTCHDRGGRTKWRERWPKCWRVGCHLSTHSNKCQNKFLRKEGAPPLKGVGCHLKGAPPLQEGRTSQYTCAQIFKINHQSTINQLGFVPSDHHLDFCAFILPLTCPHMFLYFCPCWFLLILFDFFEFLRVKLILSD